MSVTTDEKLATIYNVSTVENEAHYATVAARIESKVRWKKRVEMLKWVGLAMAIPIAASGWIYRHTNPVVETTVAYVPLMPDGSIAQVFPYEMLPAGSQRDITLNTVIGYVRARESYNSIGAGYNYNLVAALSTPKVFQEFESTDHPDLKTSPWQRYAEHTVVDFAYDSYWPLCNGFTCGPDDKPTGYTIRFRRREITNGTVRSDGFYVSQLRVIRDVEDIPAKQVQTINGARIRVDLYSRGTPDTATGAAGGR